MDVNQLMSFIDKLTPQQAAGYLSGQQPFPYQGVPQELWSPRMMAAAHKKMAKGGLVKRIDDNMAELLVKRFFAGGNVTSENEVYSLDADGRAIGKRKLSDPPLSGEVTTEPVPKTKSMRSTQQVGVFDKEGRMIGKRLTSEPLMKGEQFVEPLTAGLAIPDAATELSRTAEGMAGTVGGIASAAPKAIYGLGKKIADNYRRQQELRDGAKSKFGKAEADTLLKSIDQDSAIQNVVKAVSQGAVPPMPESNKEEAADFARKDTGGKPPVAASKESTISVSTGAPKIDYDGAKKPYEGIGKEKTYAENQTGIRSVLPKDRYEDRLKRLKEQEAGMDSDRQRDMWLGILQGAGQSMAEGNRSFFGALGSAVSGGAKNVAASEKDYRTRKGQLAEQQTKIEDASDSIARDVASKAIDMTDKQRRDYITAQAAIYGIDKDKLKNFIDLAELKIKEMTGAAQAEYYKGRGASGSKDYGYKDAVDDARQALDQMAKGNPVEYQKRLKSVNGDQNVLIDQLAKEFILRSGSSGTMPNTGAGKPDFVYNQKTGKLE